MRSIPGALLLTDWTWNDLILEQNSKRGEGYFFDDQVHNVTNRPHEINGVTYFEIRRRHPARLQSRGTIERFH